jgi:MerR family transcriptional regulator, light-induced transcriptional regulator
MTEMSLIPPAEVPGPVDLQASGRRYLEAALQGDGERALAVALELVAAGMPVAGVYRELLEPAQHQVGRLWQQNRISVAREHIATATTQLVMAGLYPHLQRAAHSRGVALVLGVEGELHQLGANMVADALEADGWDVRFLGPHVGGSEFVREVQAVRPSLVAISATMVFNLPEVRRLIRQLRDAGGGGVRVLVGGGAFRNAPNAWTAIGADARADDLLGAVQVARTLQNPPSGAGDGNLDS